MCLGESLNCASLGYLEDFWRSWYLGGDRHERVACRLQALAAASHREVDMYQQLVMLAAGATDARYQSLCLAADLVIIGGLE
jgi:hypothetical protein